MALTHFSPMFYFYTPWKHQKTEGFLTFSGGIEMAKMGWIIKQIAMVVSCAT